MKMKKRGLLCIFLMISMLSTVLLSGCSYETDSRFQRRAGDSADFPRDRQFQFNGSMNLTEEKRQQMFEERQQKMIEACEGKNEGDVCQFQVRMGKSGGICKIMDENLVCTMDRPMRQR